MLRPQPVIRLDRASFAWPDGTPVFADLTLALGPGRTGLVGANGTGKSTLLRLIAGELRPTSGTVDVEGVLGYLPQTLPLAAGQTVAGILGVASTLAALRAIEGGDAGAAYFAAVGDDWDIEERMAAVLDRLGLGEVGPERTVATLSGGQTMALGLAALLLREPDILVLDEPTNNLDLVARERLYGVVAGWRGCLLVAGHDRDLLGRMDRIAELGADGQLRLYGGNYDAYEAAVAAEQAAAGQAVRTAELQVKRERREEQDARERADRRASAGRRRTFATGMSKQARGAMQRKAEESVGRAAGQHGERLAEAEERLRRTEQRLRPDERLRLELPETVVPAGRTLFEADGAVVLRGATRIFGAYGLVLTIRGPERIALVGPNGSGKTTLLSLILGEIDPVSGRVRRAAAARLLPQRLDLLDDALSVLTNLRRFAPTVPDGELRNRLAGFLFGGDRVHLPVADLSGGERLRATLACLLAAEPASQLLLLDEPTNNLDLASVRQLEGALAAYRGALVVASHDRAFLGEIGITCWLRLEPGRGPVTTDRAGALGEVGRREGEGNQAR
ncbi:MAG: Bis-ABC ATPase SCO6720 [uncultured Thermomicrobiales bacterium]|uniref:Bis-ABC ATPase SCO6720 n=1 Tax=uncultured Thermomicrobiales bacterium TaxID=1645740 RepID=A0A6J4U504_9BACT|nr:MAG: Bis-ABC ATPase SCO6720 [uncultured Thermomicrobiales bacterium]